jgi:hypothetical protein
MGVKDWASLAVLVGFIVYMMCKRPKAHHAGAAPI